MGSPSWQRAWWSVVDPKDLKGLADVERDQHGNLRLAEVNLGDLLKHEVEQRLKTFGIKTTIMAKNIGYELRCADPIPYDMEYTRDLGYCAAQFLLEGGNAAMVSIQNGRLTPIPFAQILDPATGRMRIRMVDVRSESYQIARRYMIRLSHEDLEDPNEAAQYAAMLKLSPEAFRAQFGYLVANQRKPAT